MKRFILATFTFLAMLSCRNDDELDIEPLVGDWEWVSSNGGINGQINDTPSSTGNTIKLSFTSDNKYTITTNGTVTNEGNFRLYKDVSNLDHIERTYIDFSSTNRQMIRNNDETNLYLSDDANDGVESHYKR
ncbi:hypothetical protein GCM10010992_01170 [Cloacibacterium rupense]|uniref:Lipocalin-like domain-containing protein n=1 Tax=Cloacibacterium rupense TaxID=517423 RepID=A0ABQ2NGA5_9FLAO|nr:hypothetical protein [Cloacibacterium rupense]GGP01280.1 hypothetical protein GCM10010992_01170 [Cloacibacterium rupense]